MMTTRRSEIDRGRIPEMMPSGIPKRSPNDERTAGELERHGEPVPDLACDRLVRVQGVAEVELHGVPSQSPYWLTNGRSRPSSVPHLFDPFRRGVFTAGQRRRGIARHDEDQPEDEQADDEQQRDECSDPAENERQHEMRDLGPCRRVAEEVKQAGRAAR